MVIARKRSYRRVSNRGHGRNRGTVLFKTKASTRQYFFVAAGVQIGKPSRELDLFPIHRNGSKSALPGLALGGGDIFKIYREKPANPCMFILQVTCSFGIRGVVHYVGLQFPKYEVQHVEEIHANVRSDTAGFLNIALPGLQVPVPASGYICKINLMFRLLLGS